MGRWLDQGFADRILPCNSSTARAYAVIASHHHAGRPREEADYRIAVIPLLARCRTGDTQRARFRGQLS